MTIDRRGALTALFAGAGAQAQRPAASRSWRPKIGVYCKYSPANLEFIRKEGFTCVQLSTGGLLTPEMESGRLDEVKATIRKSGLTLVALGTAGNHLDPNAAAKTRFQDRFVRTLELAAELGAPLVATTTGAVPGQPFEKQIPWIVEAYERRYFPVCEKRGLRIIWEPHVNPVNVATGPVGFSALLKAFGDSRFVGIQMDPSHMAWQMIDPVECVREFAGKIHNVHLKDTEILWSVLRRCGIQPPDGTRWWRFRLPGSGVVDWKAFFTALGDTGYSGAMNVENEDQFTYPAYDGNDFTDSYKAGLRAAHAFVRQLAPL